MRTLDQEAMGDHIDRLYRAALALTRSREGAEDLVQDTYARILARPRFLRGDDDLPYLMGALRNTFLSRHRSATRRPAMVAVDDIELADPRTGTMPEAAFANRQLLEAIDSLPEKFRFALVAIDVAGLSYREAARALGTREATITSRLHRARQRVGELIGTENEAASRPAALRDIAENAQVRARALACA
jgi:RNA polymerase sigma-70 factor (ECF subfamily)